MNITEPGFYDLPAETYHGDPVPEGSLSQSSAKVLLDEGGPARFKAQRERPREPKHEWNLGTTVHALLLGKGEERIVHIDAPNYLTKAAKAARDAAYAEDKTPVTPAQYARARAVVDAVPESIRRRFTGGDPEVSMFWQHGSGLWLRGQADYLTDDTIVDLKTAHDTRVRGFTRALWDLKYYLQAAWYRRLAYEIDGVERDYLIVAVETSDPYLSRVIRPTQDYLDLGLKHMEQAIETYLECTASGEWPGHADEILEVDPPAWAYDEPNGIELKL